MFRTSTIIGGLAALALAVTACGSQPAASTARPAPVVTVTRTAKPAPAATVTRTAAPAAPVTDPPPSQPAQPQLSDADAVVTQFYADLSAGDYAAAWALGGSNLSNGESYAAWAAGYGTTASIGLQSSEDWGSGVVYVVISAIQDDGTMNTYDGTYTVQNGVITAASISQAG